MRVTSIVLGLGGAWQLRPLGEPSAWLRGDDTSKLDVGQYSTTARHTIDTAIAPAHGRRCVLRVNKIVPATSPKLPQRSFARL
jgi:hypothetical protein